MDFSERKFIEKRGGILSRIFPMKLLEADSGDGKPVQATRGEKPPAIHAKTWNKLHFIASNRVLSPESKEINKWCRK